MATENHGPGRVPAPRPRPLPEDFTGDPRVWEHTPGPGNCPTWCDCTHFREDPKCRHRRSLKSKRTQVWLERLDRGEDQPGPTRIGIGYRLGGGGLTTFRTGASEARFIGGLLERSGDRETAMALYKAVNLLELENGMS